MEQVSSPIAIIPARGGSQRVPGKNLQEISGKPLVAWAIEVARESRIFSRIMVNSDDQEILEVAQRFGAEAYRRPPELGRAVSYVIDVVHEMLATLETRDRTPVGILLPTCPLRTVDDICQAWEIFRENSGRSAVVSVTPYETPIQLAHYVSAQNRLIPYFPEDYRKTTRSTGHREAFRFNGAIIFTTAGVLKHQKNLVGSEPLPYIMPYERSIDIDNGFQLEMVRFIMKQNLARETPQ
jgi:CMP-N-acetylneuraminic acid synthetase